MLSPVLISQYERNGCLGVYVNDHGDGWGTQYLTSKESLTEVGVDFGEQKAMEVLTDVYKCLMDRF